MSYTLESLDNGQMMLLTLGSDFDLQAEMSQAAADCFAMLEAGPDRIVFITDGREYRVASFNDVLEGASVARRPEVQRITHHPKMVKKLTVFHSKVMQLALKGMNSATFGYYEATIFESLDEALSYARKVLYGSSQAKAV